MPSFKSGEREKLYWSIHEVAEQLGEAPSTLRFWEKETKVITPRRNNRAVRYYTPEDIGKLKILQDLIRIQGFTLSGAADKMKNKNTIFDKNSQVVSRLQQVKNKLLKLRKALSN
ncbi:MAG TPA: MerR family transcriptional regulator [Bacteroidales bacterium]|jgi:DNA-binding transcriptional MerR regulator|nr:MerR family transcriptional regulator [Bacteroidales bacterium]